jgi:hypothetical protein
MRMKPGLPKAASLVLAACLVSFAGAGFAGTAPATDRMIVAQAPTQDPKTPPDCKKYPKDVRCKDQKK